MKNNYYDSSFELSCFSDGVEFTIQKESKSESTLIFLQNKIAIDAITLPSEGAVNAIHFLLGKLIARQTKM